MSRVIETSLNNISGEFKKYNEFKDNYDILMTLPIVQKLLKKIENLKKKNKQLTEIILSQHTNDVASNENKKTTKTLKKLYDFPVKIKQERFDNDVVFVDTDNDMVFVDTDNDMVFVDTDNDVVFVDTDNDVVEVYDEENKHVLTNHKQNIFVDFEDTDTDNNDAKEVEIIVTEKEKDVVEEEEEQVEEKQVEEEESEEVAEEEEVEEEVAEEEEEEEVEEEESEEVAEEEEEEEKEQVEEATEEEEVEEEEVEETEEAIKEEGDAEEEEEGEEEEAEAVMIENKLYYTTNKTNGIIYDETLEEELGFFENGVPKFYSK